MKGVYILLNGMKDWNNRNCKFDLIVEVRKTFWIDVLNLDKNSSFLKFHSYCYAQGRHFRSKFISFIIRTNKNK